MKSVKINAEAHANLKAFSRLVSPHLSMEHFASEAIMEKIARLRPDEKEFIKENLKRSSNADGSIKN